MSKELEKSQEDINNLYDVNYNKTENNEENT